MSLIVLGAQIVAAILAATCVASAAWRRHGALAAVLAVVPAATMTRVNLPLPEPHWILRAMTLLIPCSVAALALHVLGRIRPWPALAAWVVLSVAAADVHAVPNPTGIYRAAHLSVLAAGLAAILARFPVAMRKGEKADAPNLDITDICTAVLVAQWGVGDLVAAYLRNDPWTDHPYTQHLAIFVGVVLILLQGGWLWRSRGRSSAAP